MRPASSIAHDRVNDEPDQAPRQRWNQRRPWNQRAPLHGTTALDPFAGGNVTYVILDHQLPLTA
jgi:hypothetical protein